VARIVARLTSTAWKIIKDLNAEDQRRLCDSGVQDLTTFLRTQLLEMGIPEVGKRLVNTLEGFTGKPGRR